MPLAISFDEVKEKQVRKEGDASQGTIGGVLSARLFGSRDNPALPHATLSRRDPGRISHAHYHMQNQFQVVIDGKGTIGRHKLAPYGVHFARAYTPYGPLIADKDIGLTYIVMRPHLDPGSQRLPAALEQLKKVPDRQPWQITRTARFSDAAVADVMLHEIPGIKDDQGLAAYTLSMKPKSVAYAPDHSYGDGQYVVVVQGGLLYENKEYNAWALVFNHPQEGRFQIHAGRQGLQAIIVNFPQGQPRAVAARPSTAVGLNKWQCALCSFAYDEALGLPEEGIPAGTKWKDVPDTWNCPDCGASKADFQMVEI